MKTKNILTATLIGVLFLGITTGAMAQQPRPTVPPAATSAPPVAPPSSGSPSTDVAEVNTSSCASIYGTAINWGFQNQGDVHVTLKNHAWQVEQVTSDDGHYNFGALGSGVGMLNINPGLDSLTPLINDAAVRLTCDFHTQANIALYSGTQAPTPPAQVRFSSVPGRVTAGTNTVLMLKVKNTLPDPISQVILTDLFPEGLTVEAVNASVGSAEILDGRMLTVNLGSLASGAEESVSVTLHVAEGLSGGTALANTATLFYAESAADQAHITLIVGGTGLSEADISGEAANTQADASTEGQQDAATAAEDILVSAESEQIHIVAAGDIIYNLAGQYNTTVDAILAANEGIDPKKLKIGQELIIPAGGATQIANAETAEETPPPATLPVTGLGVSFSFIALLFIIGALVMRGVRSIKRQY